MDPYRGNHEVWARSAWAAIDAAERAKLPMEGFFDGLPFDAKSLRRMRRVDWSDYGVICERMEERAGGPEGCRRLLAEGYHHVIPEIRAIAGSLVSAKALYRIVLEVVDPILLQPLVTSFEDLGEERVLISVRLRPGARPCGAFFRGSIGAFEGLPGHLDLPLPEVLFTEIDDVHGIYELQLPPSRTLAARIKRAARTPIRAVAPWILGYTSEGTPIGASFGGPTAGDDIGLRVTTATRVWKLTARQADVLRLLVQGRANKEIASDLGCAENTVELHVTQLFRRSGTSSRAQLIARFWSEL
ncbi:MAG: helix-turn-helix transcriptional regulator [Polyangiaceae bacterium]|nr:helix-turn-helix transcriptional regulator [Polyangiaceae bacterium]